MSKITVFGLNTEVNLADVLDGRRSLINLGLNPDDLVTIQGISNEINQDELRSISGLNKNLRTEILSIGASVDQISVIVNNAPDVRNPINIDLNVRESIIAKYFEYKYTDFSSNGVVKTAYISTNRNSVWNKYIDDSNNTVISYGGNLTITPSANGYSEIDFDQLIIQNEPEEKRFPTEIITDLISFRINGQEKKFYAIRSIPLKLNTVIRNIDNYEEFPDPPTLADSSVSTSTVNTSDERNTNPFIQYDSSSLFVSNTEYFPIWEILDLDPLLSSDINNSTIIDKGLSSDRLLYNSSVISGKKEIKLFYPPSKLTLLRLRYLRLEEFPIVIYENLEELDITGNFIQKFPDFSVLTPNLKSLKLGFNYDRFGNVNGTLEGLAEASKNYNDFTNERASDGTKISSNTQLSRLPSSIEQLYINSSYKNEEDIDLTSFNNLKILSFSLGSKEVPSTKKTNDCVFSTPKVNSSSIEHYLIKTNDGPNQFAELDPGLSNAPNLKTLALRKVIGNPTPNELQSFQLSANNTVIESIIIQNDTRIEPILTQNKPNLNTYIYSNHSELLSGNTFLLDNSFFQGCTSLSVVNFNSSLFVKFDINEIFRNLPSLKTIDIVLTKSYGVFTANTFVGSENNLRNLFFGQSTGRFKSSSFIGAYSNNTQIPSDTFEINSLSSLDSLLSISMEESASGAGNDFVQGLLPNFPKNIENINLVKGSFSGNLVNPPSSVINMTIKKCNYKDPANNSLGALPSIVSNKLETLDLSENNLTGSINLNTPELQLLNLSFNKLSGDLPNFNNLTPKITTIFLGNNNIASYNKGSFGSNLKNLTTVDLKNNNLDEDSILKIMQDFLSLFPNTLRSGQIENLDFREQANINESAKNRLVNSKEYKSLTGTIVNWSVSI